MITISSYNFDIILRIYDILAIVTGFIIFFLGFNKIVSSNYDYRKRVDATDAFTIKMLIYIIIALALACLMLLGNETTTTKLESSEPIVNVQKIDDNNLRTIEFETADNVLTTHNSNSYEIADENKIEVYVDSKTLKSTLFTVKDYEKKRYAKVCLKEEDYKVLSDYVDNKTIEEYSLH